MNKVLDGEVRLLKLLYEKGDITRLSRQEILRFLEMDEHIFNYITNDLNVKELIYVPAKLTITVEPHDAGLSVESIVDLDMPMGEIGDQDVKRVGYGITEEGKRYVEKFYLGKHELERKVGQEIVYESPFYKISAHKIDNSIEIREIELVVSSPVRPLTIRSKLKGLMEFFLQEIGKSLEVNKFPPKYRARLSKDISDLNVAFKKYRGSPVKGLNSEAYEESRKVFEKMPKVNDLAINYDCELKAYCLNGFKIVQRFKKI